MMQLEWMLHSACAATNLLSMTHGAATKTNKSATHHVFRALHNMQLDMQDVMFDITWLVSFQVALAGSICRASCSI